MEEEEELNVPLLNPEELAYELSEQTSVDVPSGAEGPIEEED